MREKWLAEEQNPDLGNLIWKFDASQEKEHAPRSFPAQRNVTSTAAISKGSVSTFVDPNADWSGSPLFPQVTSETN